MCATCACTLTKGAPQRRQFLAIDDTGRMVTGLNHEESARGKANSRMARKRQYGSGQLKEAREGWVIRWWEPEIARDGSKQKALRYERLGPMSRKQAAKILAQRLAESENAKVVRSRIVFRTLVAEASVLPMYNRRRRSIVGSC